MIASIVTINTTHKTTFVTSEFHACWAWRVGALHVRESIIPESNNSSQGFCIFSPNPTLPAHGLPRYLRPWQVCASTLMRAVLRHACDRRSRLFLAKVSFFTPAFYTPSSQRYKPRAVSRRTTPEQPIYHCPPADQTITHGWLPRSRSPAGFRQRHGRGTASTRSARTPS